MSLYIGFYSSMILPVIPQLSWEIVRIFRRTISFIYMGSDLHVSARYLSWKCCLQCRLCCRDTVQTSRANLPTSLPPVTSCLWSRSRHGCDTGMHWSTGSCQGLQKPSIHISATVTPVAQLCKSHSSSQLHDSRRLNLVMKYKYVLFFLAGRFRKQDKIQEKEGGTIKWIHPSIFY